MMPAYACIHLDRVSKVYCSHVRISVSDVRLQYARYVGMHISVTMHTSLYTSAAPPRVEVIVSRRAIGGWEAWAGRASG